MITSKEKADKNWNDNQRNFYLDLQLIYYFHKNNVLIYCCCISKQFLKYTYWNEIKVWVFDTDLDRG